MTVYVASGLAEYREVLAFEDDLRRCGAGVSYSWASDYAAEVGTGARPDRLEVAERCRRGVLDADAVLLWCPGKRGAHVEFGIAVGAGKWVATFNPDPAKDISFYLLGPVFRTAQDLLEWAVRQ